MGFCNRKFLGLLGKCVSEMVGPAASMWSMKRWRGGDDTAAVAGDSSFKKLGGEGVERDGAIGWREGLEPGGLGCCYFKMIKGLGVFI